MKKYFSIIFLVVTCMACRSAIDICPSYPLDYILDCTLPQISLPKQGPVFVSDQLGWDSIHSVVVITFPSWKLGEVTGVVQTGTYKGCPVYLDHGRLTMTQGVISLDSIGWSKESILTSIKWEQQQLDQPISDLNPPYSPPEIQLLYNPAQKCIEEIVLVRWLDVTSIEISCHMCSCKH